MEITHFSRKGQGLDAKNRSEQSSIGNTKQWGKTFHGVASDIFYDVLFIILRFNKKKSIQQKIKINFWQILRKRSNSTRYLF